MTIVCDAPEHAADRIRASLYKLETTSDVDEVNRGDAVIRELCLIKVAAGPNSPHGVSTRAPRSSSSPTSSAPASSTSPPSPSCSR